MQTPPLWLLPKAVADLSALKRVHPSNSIMLLETSLLSQVSEKKHKTAVHKPFLCEGPALSFVQLVLQISHSGEEDAR